MDTFDYVFWVFYFYLKSITKKSNKTIYFTQYNKTQQIDLHTTRQDLDS